MSLLPSLKSLKIPADWNLVPVGKVLQDTQYGTNAPTVKSGSISIVGMKDIQGGRILTDNLTKTELPENEKLKFLLRKGDLLINRTNSYDLVGKVGIFYSDKEAVFASYLVRLITDRDQVDPEYLNYWLNSYKAQVTIKKIATRAISQANINPTEFKKYCLVPLPPPPEQTAIADLLSTWDVAIKKMGQLVTAKQKQRKGLMRQLLSGKRRFPGFTKPWKEVRIGEIFNRVTRKNNSGIDRVLTASGTHGLIDQKDYFHRSVSSDSLAGYYHLRQGEFAYNRSAMKGYPYGAIKRLNDYEHGVLSTLYLCFSLSSADHCSDFFTHYFEAGILNRQLRKIVQVGARAHGLLNVISDDFFNLKLQVPGLDEQEKIADFLTICDQEISLYLEQLDAFKEQKTGLMQLLITGKARVKPMNEAVV